MQFSVKTGAPASQKTACAILPLFEGSSPADATRALDQAAGGLVRRLTRAGDASSDLGKTLLVHDTHGTAAQRFLLVGCGKRAEFGPKQLVTALGAAMKALEGTGVREAVSWLGAEARDVDAYYAARLSVETVRAAAYRFDECKSKPGKALKLARFGLAAAAGADAADARRGMGHGSGIAAGADLARDLGNRPANVCTPTHLAKTAEDLAKQYAQMETKVLGEREIKRLGMGAFLSVTHGAEEPAKLIVIEYRGDAEKSPPVALCGKGITFDTGGISLKPPAKMDEMKFDMCGAAGVLGTMKALGELQPKVNVVAIVPACENMPGSRATRPGDIVKSLSGQTIEILNTDAEGRLVLSDALAYAKRFEPRCILDVATLTGACVVALGPLYTGVFTKDEALATSLLEAGRRSRDLAWRLPLDEEYGESLKSNFADFANAGSREGGASIAAQFLSRFVDTTPWAHLDIAGVAWKSDANKGATGRPVPLLMDFLLNL